MGVIPQRWQLREWSRHLGKQPGGLSEGWAQHSPMGQKRTLPSLPCEKWKQMWSLQNIHGKCKWSNNVSSSFFFHNKQLLRNDFYMFVLKICSKEQWDVIHPPVPTTARAESRSPDPHPGFPCKWPSPAASQDVFILERGLHCRKLAVCKDFIVPKS